MEVILRSKISHIDPRFCTGMVEFCHRLWVKRPAFEFAPWFIGWKEKVSAGVRSCGRAPGRHWLWYQCSCSEVEPMSIEAADFRDMAFPSFLVLLRLWSYTLISFVTAGICNRSKWEADIWGWFEVRRSAVLHYKVNQSLHWTCQQYDHPGMARRWEMSTLPEGNIPQHKETSASCGGFHCVCEVL